MQSSNVKSNVVELIKFKKLIEKHT